MTSTRLPVVSSIATVIRWVSLGLCVAGLGHALFCLLRYDDPWWAADLPWSGALPVLVAAPVFGAAWLHWRRRRIDRAALLMFVALLALSSLANWPRGAFSPAWYLHPFLALLATMALGVIPGLGLTLAAVTVMLLAASVGPAAVGVGTGAGGSVQGDVWVHVTSLCALTLASALVGAITNRLVFMALVTAESQRRKNFESSRALRYREKLLRHALRVETVGDLAGMVCHQLRNAHQVLLGHVTLAMGADETERTERLAAIERTLGETQPLLQQLMRMAHPDEGATTPTDLSALAREFFGQARLIVPEAITMRSEIADGPLPALINPQGLSHALWNLVINARQALGGSGMIRIRCGGNRSQVWIEIADDGPGIPAEVRERIYDPYFTTKPPGQGTGLGLTAVARFVRASNGVIQLASEIEEGTAFRMRFPRAAESAEATAARGAAGA